MTSEHPENVEYDILLGMCDRRAGQYLYALGRVTESSVAMRKALDRLAARKGNPEAARRLAETHNDYALVLHALGKKKESAEHYRESLAYVEPARKEELQFAASQVVRAKALSNYAILLREERQYPRPSRTCVSRSPSWSN